jgi:hypothetical protein
MYWRVYFKLFFDSKSAKAIVLQLKKSKFSIWIAEALRLPLNTLRKEDANFT